MRRYPENDYEFKELEKLNAKPWQVELLKKNPDYVYWGNHEDYMVGGTGWAESIQFPNIEEGGLFHLDEYNELVHFYFAVNRESKDCKACNCTGYNPETKKLFDDWYSSKSRDMVELPNGRFYNNAAWCNHLTEVEVEALVKEGRLRELVGINCDFDEEEGVWYGWVNGGKVIIDPPKMPTPEEVNAWNREGGLGHDALNRYIAVEARAKHQGVFGKCEHCEGNGYTFTKPEAEVSLQLWYLHPRKGSSRGVFIEEIKEHEIPKIIEFLKEAKERNEQRFSKL